MTSPDQLKSLATRFVQEHNQPNYKDAFNAMLSPDCLIHEFLPGLPNPMNVEIYTGFIGSFRGALPDIKNTIEEIVAEGDTVVVRWKGTGTHTGAELMGQAAKGNKLVANGVYILKFKENRICELWDFWDNLNVAQQIGG